MKVGLTTALPFYFTDFDNVLSICPDNFNHGYDSITVSLVLINTSGDFNRYNLNSFKDKKNRTKCIQCIQSKTLKQSSTISYSPIQRSIRKVSLPQTAGQLSKSPIQYSFLISSLWCIKVVNKDSLVR